jgi:hypothetical protein
MSTQVSLRRITRLNTIMKTPPMMNRMPCTMAPADTPLATSVHQGTGRQVEIPAPWQMRRMLSLSYPVTSTISSRVMPDMAAPAMARASRFLASTSSSWIRW